MPRVADRVKDTGTVTGTGAVTLSNTSSSGFQTMASAFGAIGYPVTVWYVIEDGAGGWEAGSGTLTSATNLERDGVVSGSSNAGALINFGTSTAVTIFCALTAHLTRSSGLGRALALRNHLAGL